MWVKDYVLNERGYGPVGEALDRIRFDTGMARPYLVGNHLCVTIQTGQMTYNEETMEYEPEFEEVRVNDLREAGIDNDVWRVDNSYSLRKEDWARFDQRITMATRQRLRAWTDAFTAVGTSYDGYGQLTHEYEAMNDPGEAVVDMDMMTFGRTDKPLFKLRSVPLPITHSDFWFSDRYLAVSRNRGTPVSTTMGEAAGRRVAETVEQTMIGTEVGVEFGTVSTGLQAHDGLSKVYGYTTFPARNTKTDLTTPTGTNPEAVMTDVLEMIETLQTDGFFGPYVLYTSTGYSRYLNDDYFRTGSTSAVRSLRERLMEIEGIVDIRRLDYLTSGFQLILVQLDRETVEAINGMEIQTFMHEGDGPKGRKYFRVACIHVPLIKSDFNGNTGIVHGTTS